jgi:hypothetical protein
LPAWPQAPSDSDSWEIGAEARETRGYHSVALLTPDGRVWSAGSEVDYGSTPNLTIELFEPGYYMLWIVDANERPCKVAPFIRLG